MDWWNLMKQSVTVGAQLLWSSRYGCNNGRYGCTIVMSYIEINKAVSQWLLTFNLCVSVTWPLTCAFHIPCMHTPEIIDMHRGMCDNLTNFLHLKFCGIVDAYAGFEISNWTHLSVGQVHCKNHLSESTIHLSEICKANATYKKIRNTQSSVGQVL